MSVSNSCIHKYLNSESDSTATLNTSNETHRDPLAVICNFIEISDHVLWMKALRMYVEWNHSLRGSCLVGLGPETRRDLHHDQRTVLVTSLPSKEVGRATI